MPKCKYCKEQGLRWVYTAKQGWRLYPNNGPVHTCSAGLRAAQQQRARELPQPAEERYPEQYARYTQSLEEARALARAPDAVPARGSLAGIPTQAMLGPEFDFLDIPKS